MLKSSGGPRLKGKERKISVDRKSLSSPKAGIYLSPAAQMACLLGDVDWHVDVVDGRKEMLGHDRPTERGAPFRTLALRHLSILDTFSQAKTSVSLKPHAALISL
jgi:hypothetical protein